MRPEDKITRELMAAALYDCDYDTSLFDDRTLDRWRAAAAKGQDALASVIIGGGTLDDALDAADRLIERVEELQHEMPFEADPDDYTWRIAMPGPEQHCYDRVYLAVDPRERIVYTWSGVGAGAPMDIYTGRDPAVRVPVYATERSVRAFAEQHLSALVQGDTHPVEIAASDPSAFDVYTDPDEWCLFQGQDDDHLVNCSDEELQALAAEEVAHALDSNAVVDLQKMVTYLQERQADLRAQLAEEAAEAAS